MTGSVWASKDNLIVFPISLPGREALYDPGKKAGQMKMIREPHGVVAYTWVEDGQNSHWEKVGDVLGGTDKDATGKTVHEGKVNYPPHKKKFHIFKLLFLSVL